MSLNTEEKARKKELEDNLFKERPKEEKTEHLRWHVRPKEVLDFLRLAARSHQYLFQYTDLNALKGMLSSRKLWLTRATDLNDMKEFAGYRTPRNAYVASFTMTHRENMGMWWMYGLRGQERPLKVPVRLQFGAVAIQKVIAGAEKAVWTPNGKKELEVERVDFFDVLYQFSKRGENGASGSASSAAVAWNGKTANAKRCPGAFDNAVAQFPGFVKEGGWDYERETRLVVYLRKSVPYDKIAIEFGPALDTMRVCTGPGTHAHDYPDRVLRALERLHCQAEVEPSDYVVHFLKPRK